MADLLFAGPDNAERRTPGLGHAANETPHLLLEGSGAWSPARQILPNHCFQLEPPTPVTEADRQKAARMLIGSIEYDNPTARLIPEHEAVPRMIQALMSGDSKSFGSAVAEVGNRPEMLKAFIQEMNQHVPFTHMRLEDGKLLVYPPDMGQFHPDPDTNIGVEFDIHTGASHVVRLNLRDPQGVIDGRAPDETLLRFATISARRLLPEKPPPSRFGELTSAHLGDCKLRITDQP